MIWLFRGRDPAPLQRPFLAGTVAAAIASIPAAALVWFTGAAHMPASVIGVSPPVLIAMSVGELIVSGMLYGLTFMRAANDRRGGWLFGLGWGFLTWTLGPITLCQWILGRPIAHGPHAALLLLAHLLWGVIFGALYPLVQNKVEMSVEDAPPPREVSLHRRNPQGQVRERYRKVSGKD